MIYLVTYNLNSPGRNYSTLYEAVERYEHIKDPKLESVVFLASGWEPDQIYDDLRQYMDDSDRLFVTRINSNEYRGWVSLDVVDWLQQNER